MHVPFSLFAKIASHLAAAPARINFVPGRLKLTPVEVCLTPTTGRSNLSV
jgi:hypothetical protein